MFACCHRYSSPRSGLFLIYAKPQPVFKLISFSCTRRASRPSVDRYLKPNEVHAQCVAESVLLDVRTGIVADTARATENIALTKASSDLNFSETVARAESDARGKALVSLAQMVVKRLAKADE